MHILYSDNLCNIIVIIFEKTIDNVHQKVYNKDTERERKIPNTRKANAMTKTNELKEKFTSTFANRENWDQRVEINGDEYVYMSCRNEIRKIVKYDLERNLTMAVLIGCFAVGQFVWCD